MLAYKNENKCKHTKRLSSVLAPNYDVRIPWGANPPTYYLKSILECFPLLDLHEADLSGPVSETVRIRQVLHSSSKCMLDTPFAGTINTHTNSHTKAHSQAHIISILHALLYNN